MIYLDYSATTPVNKEVLESFNKVCMNYVGNPNSLHKLGNDSHKLMDAATKQISELLGVKSNEIIFTSGASESNNLAIFGVLNQYTSRGKHIVTTKLEHSSILAGMNYLKQNGYKDITTQGVLHGLCTLSDRPRRKRILIPERKKA